MHQAPTVYPAHRLFAHPTIAGQGAILESPQYRIVNGQPSNLSPPQFDDKTQANLISIQSHDPQDAVTVGITAQMYQILSGDLGSGDLDPTQVDVVAKLRWGAGGAQNFAIMKLGNGIALSVPASMLRFDVQNLRNRVGVTAGAAPYPLRAGAIGQPHYSYLIAMPANGTALIPRLSDLNAVVPEPQVIPPYAQRMSVSLVGAVAGTLTVTQLAPGDNVIRQDQLTGVAQGGANGVAFLDSVQLFAECSVIELTGASQALPFNVNLDFEIGL